ncbi:MAG TPA: M1 family aminopeptidase [Terriglobia bacterium]|nr:M1 family aminopeptidase [Terriglobia bacterium]
MLLLLTSKIVTCRFWRVLVLMALALVASTGPCQEPGKPATQSPAASADDPHELLKQLDDVSVDPGQIYALRNVRITRDHIEIYFNRGFVGFFAPVGGAITGAVFSGDGEVLMIPPSAVEKRNLAQFAQSPILEEQFSSAYLRFTDETARELLAQARRPDPEDTEQPTGFTDEWTPVIRGLNPAQSMRILQDLLGERDRPYFQARIQGVHLGWFEVSDDERQPEAIRIGGVESVQGRLFANLWCSFPSRTSQARSESLITGSAAVHSYTIDTRINADNSLDGRAELDLESRSNRDRVLFFELSHRLKVFAVSEVEGDRKRSVTFFQSPSLEESRTAARGNDWVVAVLPAAYPVGKMFRLEFVYRGDVIEDVGNGVLYVGAHGIWYPNRDLLLGARYDLTFHYPDRLTLVATGNRVEEKSADGWKHSHWVSDGALPVAGFNLGAYEERVRRVGDATIEAYATAGVESSLERRRPPPQPSTTTLAIPHHEGGPASVNLPASALALPLDPAALLESVADRAARAVRYFETLFGPFPYSRLALSQIPGSFGQGWPELVYLPSLSFLSSSTRSELAGRTSDDLEEQVSVPHEIAHQWWGNEVGWKTYHDQWISEGFATYAATLELTLDKDGEQKFHQLMREYKRDLLSRNKSGDTVESGGPIWLGERLSNSLNPTGYDAIVYKKASWVLHMLRLMVIDPEPGGAARPRRTAAAQPDERFFKALREFVATYRGRSASTEDFVRSAEKYMTPAADLDHNHRLNWFFEDWVYGVGIPTYKLHVSTRRAASGRFVIQGNVEQSDVPGDFEMPVPLIANYGKDKVVPLGRVVVSDSGGRFKFTVSSKPTRVQIDEDQILAVAR